MSSGRAEAARFQAAADLLRLVRQRPGLTRSAAAAELGLSSGSATEIAARLRGLGLLDEQPAPATGRGRPSTVLGAGPDGPLAAVVDIRHEDWRAALVDLTGARTPLGAGRHTGGPPDELLGTIRRTLRNAHRRYGSRLRAVSVAIVGTVRGERLMQASTLGWGDVDLGPLGVGLPLMVGNDASLAGVAEARRAAGDARAVLYLTVEVGIGGVLVDAGRPITGATGAGGEFGHLPFGDPGRRCPCGATGCWDLEVDGRAMARYRRRPQPADPWTYAADTIASADPGARRAVERCAIALGRGTAGLVNALDPDAVRLGGLAAPMYEAAGEALRQAYRSGLMAFRRAAPPPLSPATVGADGPLLGAADVAFDEVLTEAGLAAWAADHAG